MPYDLLPEGDDYVGCVIPQHDGQGQSSVVFGESAKKQTPYASVKLGITEGEFSGRWMFWTGYLTEKTIVKTVKALHAMGFKGNRLTDFMNQQPSEAVTFGIAHEEYEGKVRARVKWVGAAVVKLQPSALDALSDQFEKLAEAEDPEPIEEAAPPANNGKVAAKSKAGKQAPLTSSTDPLDGLPF